MAIRFPFSNVGGHAIFFDFLNAVKIDSRRYVAVSWIGSLVASRYDAATAFSTSKFAVKKSQSDRQSFQSTLENYVRDTISASFSNLFFKLSDQNFSFGRFCSCSWLMYLSRSTNNGSALCSVITCFWIMTFISLYATACALHNSSCVSFASVDFDWWSPLNVWDLLWKL